MLVCLTPNPAIDRVLVVPGFRSAEVCRVQERRDLAGGKGLNVARAARTLGFQARAIGPLAGDTGRTIAALAAAEGLDAEWTWLPAGESRVCVLVTDPAAHDTLTINEQGPLLTPADWTLVADHIRAQAIGAYGLTSSGSLPQGVDPAAFASFLTELADTVPVFLDTSGPSLRAALSTPLTMIKVNGHELGDALGRTVETPEQAASAARATRARGPRTAVVTLGSAGAVAVNEHGAWHAAPPPIAPVSPVGSGDTLMAGLATALLRGEPLAEALRLGVACGTANALVLGAGVMRSDDITALLSAVTLRQL